MSLTNTPINLVEGHKRRYGRFTSRPSNVNPLDEFGGLARAFRNYRLKEWVGFTMIHHDWYSSFIIQDAHYLGSSEIYAYDRQSKSLYQHAANSGPGLGLPADLYGGHCEFVKPGYKIAYDFARDQTQHILRFDIAATEKAPAFQGELTLDAAHASPTLSVSAPLPARKARMYTNKVIFPVSGAIHIGDRAMVFDPARDMAILDEHHSLLPYNTYWVWGTFAQRTPAGIIGANFARRPTTPGSEEESAIWTPTACEPLADITFTPQSSDPMAPIHVTSKDGRLDAIFEPEGRKGVDQNLVIFEIHYFQLYGRYRGTVRSLDGTTYQFADVPGVCETMRARL